MFKIEVINAVQVGQISRCRMIKYPIRYIYNKIVNIEGRTMLDMAVHQILPAAMRYTDNLSQAMFHKQSLNLPCKAETVLAKLLSENSDALFEDINALKEALATVPKDPESASFHYRDRVIPAMETMRLHADILEANTSKSYWPYPTYSGLLFY